VPLQSLIRVDNAASSSRVLWVGLGQLGLAALGVHLAADHLDDQLFSALVWCNDALAPAVQALSLKGLAADQLQAPAAWFAIGVELLADLYLFLCLALTSQAPKLSWGAYKRALSARAVLVPLFWIPISLAGSWVVAMAIEDSLVDLHAMGAQVIGVGLALLVAWRLGFSGLRRVLGSLEPPEKRSDGWPWAFLVLPLAALAIRYGLPIWGWL
jgi:hypothetical protein